MGYPSSIFDPEPPASCICAICHDVLQHPSTCKECGHTFCRECIENCLEVRPTCPSCRVAVSGIIPNYFAQESIDVMHVKCPAHSDDKDGGDDGAESGRSAKKRRLLLQDGSAAGAEAAAVPDGCAWTGQVKDLKEHWKECGFVNINCSVDGCNHRCRRRDMEDHLSGVSSFLRHIDLMKTSITASVESKYDENLKRAMSSMESKFDEKLKEAKAAIESRFDGKLKKVKALVELKYDHKVLGLNKSFEAFEKKTVLETNHLLYMNCCREWIKNKTDALFNFKIYKIKSKGGPHVIGLLCGIPGPIGSSWEGAMIPMVFRYTKTVGKPPYCKLPPDFFSPDAMKSGTLLVPILRDDVYTGDETLPEILFNAQQLLSHPDIYSPANDDVHNILTSNPDSYHARVRKEACEVYTEDNFFQNYKNINSKMYGEDAFDGVVDEGEVFQVAHQFCDEKPKAELSTAPPPPLILAKHVNRNKHSYDEYADCKCSCCAWGQTLWDDQKKMRFILNGRFC